ncbi:MAG: hypothetical protein WD070_12630, partial [Pirellulaceae bacterium]
ERSPHAIPQSSENLNMNPREHTAATRRCFIVLVCPFVLAIAGCHGNDVEEAEHHLPEHKPADFPSAVDRLLALHVEISNCVARAADQLDVFSETYDIVRWLPDLAADSDLEEQPWNRVQVTTRRLEAILLDVLSRSGTDRREPYLQYETELDQHQRELLDIKQLFPASAALAADGSP